MNPPMQSSPPGGRFFRPRPAERRQNVLAVGGRVLVVDEVVMLTDENRIATGATLGRDVEVEIVAWRPGGPHGACYRVRCASQGVEGWVDAPSLRARPVPPAPRRATIETPPPAKKTTRARKS